MSHLGKLFRPLPLRFRAAATASKSYISSITQPVRPNILPAAALFSKSNVVQFQRTFSSSPTAFSNGASGRPSSKFSQQLPDPERGPIQHPTFDVGGRVYVVTGGAQGLGLMMAETLAENGAHGRYNSD